MALYWWQMRYCLDAEKMNNLLRKRGFASLAEFARTHRLNRATLHHYIKGQGGPFPESYYAICNALKADPLSLLVPVTEVQLANISEMMPIIKNICLADEKVAVGLLGSRARDKARKYSDWDIGITRGSNPLGGVEFLRLKRHADEAIDRLAREVDILNLDAAPDWFLRGIDYTPVYLAGDTNAWAFFLGVLHGAKKG